VIASYPIEIAVVAGQQAQAVLFPDSPPRMAEDSPHFNLLNGPGHAGDARVEHVAQVDLLESVDRVGVILLVGNGRFTKRRKGFPSDHPLVCVKLGAISSWQHWSCCKHRLFSASLPRHFLDGTGFVVFAVDRSVVLSEQVGGRPANWRAGSQAARWPFQGMVQLRGTIKIVKGERGKAREAREQRRQGIGEFAV
jgi:hypothetical protein